MEELVLGSSFCGEEVDVINNQPTGTSITSAKVLKLPVRIASRKLLVNASAVS